MTKKGTRATGTTVHKIHFMLVRRFGLIIKFVMSLPSRLSAHSRRQHGNRTQFNVICTRARVCVVSVRVLRTSERVKRCARFVFHSYLFARIPYNVYTPSRVVHERYPRRLWRYNNNNNNNVSLDRKTYFDNALSGSRRYSNESEQKKKKSDHKVFKKKGGGRTHTRTRGRTRGAVLLPRLLPRLLERGGPRAVLFIFLVYIYFYFFIVFHHAPAT